MTPALAGDAVLFVAIAAPAGLSEWRSRATLRAIRGDFAEIRRWMETTDARLAALESRKNGGDHLAVDAMTPDHLARLEA